MGNACVYERHGRRMQWLRCTPGNDRLQHAGLEVRMAPRVRTRIPGASHSLDAVNRLNGDSPPVWCQATLEDGDSLVHMEDGTQKPMVESGENGGEGIIRGDPVGHGTVRFENGVTAYMLNSGRGMEVEAVCESGIITSLNVRLAV